MELSDIYSERQFVISGRIVGLDHEKVVGLRGVLCRRKRRWGSVER